MVRFQALVVPKDSSPTSLKRVFQYLAHLVKLDLISECTLNDTKNYRPLTFTPDFIFRSTDGKKRYPVDGNDWIAANLMIFQNLANLLYGISLEFCNPTCCPIMTVGNE